MRFRSYEALNLFVSVSKYKSFTEASAYLHMTKGAISYQMRILEEDLGFAIFERKPGGVTLTEQGKILQNHASLLFKDLDRQITRLRDMDQDQITVGLSTYFASRWLSPRLMHFTNRYPNVALRLHPMVDLVDTGNVPIDMTIRWGRGKWDDMVIEPLLDCPAFPTIGNALSEKYQDMSEEEVLKVVNLLSDRDDSRAWEEWHKIAGYIYSERKMTLVVPDPNVRVQAVIDNQGLALNDDLVAEDLKAGKLTRFSQTSLPGYGYFLAYGTSSMENPALKLFRDWLLDTAA